MKKAAILIFSFVALAMAQDKAPETVKRLSSVTWDLNTHKLVWVVQTGTEVNGEFVPKASSKYEVSPDDANMKFADETRGFTAEEAASLHHLLDVLSLYCAESTEWWEQGQGAPTGTKTTVPETKGNPVKVDQHQQTPPKKGYRVPATDYVAER